MKFNKTTFLLRLRWVLSLLAVWVGGAVFVNSLFIFVMDDLPSYGYALLLGGVLTGLGLYWMPVVYTVDDQPRANRFLRVWTWIFLLLLGSATAALVILSPPGGFTGRLTDMQPFPFWLLVVWFSCFGDGLLLMFVYARSQAPPTCGCKIAT